MTHGHFDHIADAPALAMMHKAKVYAPGDLNQTLTAVFFFRVPEGTSFRDDYVDNFVAH